MKWEKGQSGNPAGRTPKTDHGIAAALRRRILASAPEIIDSLIEAAKSGDVVAGRSLMAVCVPALKPVELPATLPPIPPDSGLAAQGAAVFDAMASGKLSPSQGAALIGSIGVLARLIESDELQRRVTETEKAVSELRTLGVLRK